jgi:hypothetical protein
MNYVANKLLLSSFVVSPETIGSLHRSVILFSSDAIGVEVSLLIRRFPGERCTIVKHPLPGGAKL